MADPKRSSQGSLAAHCVTGVSVAHKVLVSPHCLVWKETATMLLFCPFFLSFRLDVLGREGDAGVRKMKLLVLDNGFWPCRDSACCNLGDFRRCSAAVMENLGVCFFALIRGLSPAPTGRQWLQ